ncbi:unnamed protein product [Clonostachys rosea f. rosea IK726]|uniref:RCC1-like domain-containing protein n=2 Tax=Bionectria ochroleuca TaxID=29856 RepID=A0A0B7KN36_BIOOC|nr:unnamed protein product [Clonostachys rosea f. rosea IK726]
MPPKRSSQRGKAPRATGSGAVASNSAPIKRERQDDAPQNETRAKRARNGSKPAQRRQGNRAGPASDTPLNKAPKATLSVFAFGSGDCSELGLGMRISSATTPRFNPYLDPQDPTKFHVVHIACGGMHSVALTKDNQILTWGVNDEGALGRDTQWEGGVRDADGDDSDDEEPLNPHESTPTAISGDSFPQDTKFVQVAAGDSCSFALTDRGLVYGWGAFRDPNGDQRFCYDSDGKVIKIQRTPVLISKLQNIVQITCGANHVLALGSDGQIWGWGAFEKNQLGTRPFGRHQETLLPRQVRVCRTPIKYIASGDYHSFAIDRKDNVWAWGLNSFGEAGYAKDAGSDSAILPYPMKIRGLTGQGVVALDGGAHHSAAVTLDGQCLVWGRMDGGQLGVEFTPEQLDDPTVVRRDEHEKPRICLQPVPVPAVGKGVDVGCGTDHTIFINDEGKGFSTGINSSGQLGLGTEDDEEIAKPFKGKTVKTKHLTWAGAGGQYSVVAAAEGSQ